MRHVLCVPRPAIIIGRTQLPPPGVTMKRAKLKMGDSLRWRGGGSEEATLGEGLLESHIC